MVLSHENPPILPGEDKKLLRHFNHKKVTLFSVGKRSGAVARQAGGLVFPLFSAEQSDGDYGKPDRRGDPEREREHHNCRYQQHKLFQF